MNALQQSKILHAAYFMINDVKIAHLEVRRIGNFLKYPLEAIRWANNVLDISGAQETALLNLQKKFQELNPLKMKFDN